MFYRDDLPRLRQIQRRVSKKVRDSITLPVVISASRTSGAISTSKKRMIFEDLNINGMKRLWGRKVSDLGSRQFMILLKWVAFKRVKKIVVLPRFERTTGKCSGCGHRQKLEFSERTFCCAACGLTLDRDRNTALICLLSQPEEVPATSTASGVHGRSPLL